MAGASDWHAEILFRIPVCTLSKALFKFASSMGSDVNGGPAGRNILRPRFQTLNLSFTYFYLFISLLSTNSAVLPLSLASLGNIGAVDI